MGTPSMTDQARGAGHTVKALWCYTPAEMAELSTEDLQLALRLMERQQTQMYLLIAAGVLSVFIVAAIRAVFA